MSMKGWIVTVLAVPILYILTTPPLIFVAAKHFSHSQPVMNFMQSYSEPFLWLQHQKALAKPLSDYLMYWQEVIGYNPRTFPF